MSLTNEAAFISHLDTISSSAVIVGRHSSLLASSVFMMPGVCPYDARLWALVGLSGKVRLDPKSNPNPSVFMMPVVCPLNSSIAVLEASEVVESVWISANMI